MKRILFVLVFVCLISNAFPQRGNRGMGSTHVDDIVDIQSEANDQPTSSPKQSNPIGNRKSSDNIPPPAGSIVDENITTSNFQSKNASLDKVDLIKSTSILASNINPEQDVKKAIRKYDLLRRMIKHWYSEEFETLPPNVKFYAKPKTQEEAKYLLSMDRNDFIKNPSTNGNYDAWVYVHTLDYWKSIHNKLSFAPEARIEDGKIPTEEDLKESVQKKKVRETRLRKFENIQRRTKRIPKILNSFQNNKEFFDSEGTSQWYVDVAMLREQHYPKTSQANKIDILEDEFLYGVNGLYGQDSNIDYETSFRGNTVAIFLSNNFGDYEKALKKAIVNRKKIIVFVDKLDGSLLPFIQDSTMPYSKNILCFVLGSPTHNNVTIMPRKKWINRSRLAQKIDSFDENYEQTMKDFEEARKIIKKTTGKPVFIFVRNYRLHMDTWLYAIPFTPDGIVYQFAGSKDAMFKQELNFFRKEHLPERWGKEIPIMFYGVNLQHGKRSPRNVNDEVISAGAFGLWFITE